MGKAYLNCAANSVRDKLVDVVDAVLYMCLCHKDVIKNCNEGCGKKAQILGGA